MKLLFTLLGATITFFCTAQRASKPFANTLGNRNAVGILSVAYKPNREHHNHFEAGTLISICKVPVQLLIANFQFNKVSNADAFTLHIYRVSNGRPTNHVLYGPFNVPGETTKGMISVDLKEYAIQLDEDFFVALRYSGENDQEEIAVVGKLKGSKSFHRSDTSGEWEPTPIVNLAFSVSVLTDRDLPCTVNLFKVTALSPGITIERSTSKFQTLTFRLYASTAFGISFSTSEGTNTAIIFNPAIMSQYRFYYDGLSRSKKGKRTSLNSMNYIAASLACIFTRRNISEQYLTANERRPFLEPAILWGMQRNYSKRFSLDLSCGPGAYITRSTKSGSVNSTITAGLKVISNVTFGWWLGHR